MTRLEIIRTLAARPEQVWRAFTDPAAVTAWFWPHLDNTAEIDLRPHGRFRIAGPKAGMTVSGEYLEVVPPKRLVFTWQWDGEDEQSRVTLELGPARDGTTLRLLHDRLPDDAARELHRTGWNDCLDRLPDWLAAG